MQIEYSKKFLKKFKKCPVNIQTAFKKRLQIFINDEHNQILNNHNLLGTIKDFRSINITGDWRAIFEPIDSGKIAHFVNIGTHSQLYS